MRTKLLSLSLLLASVSGFAAYEDHFPVYFEYCVGTQWKLQSGEEGGSPGHGFAYIHGLCKDYRSSYPQVIPCSEVSTELKAQYPHEGVGISLDKNFANVMWVAVPGRDLMIFGEKESKPIMMTDVKEQVKKINDLKVFNDVKVKVDSVNQLPFNSPEYLDALAEVTLGTDHAVNWARELHCSRIPAKKESLPLVAKFLNDSNNQHRNGPDYVWSKLSNNCVHISMNASHLMGINKSIKVDQKFPKLLFNMAVPSNGFMMYADLSALGKTPSVRKLTKALKKNGMSPVQVGALLEVHRAFPTGEKFNTDDLTILTLPRVKKPLKLLTTPRKYEKYFTPKNTELKANAEMWIGRYETLLSKLGKDQVGSEVEEYLQNQLELAKKIQSAEN